ncbi:MAG: hypothetical protein KC657_16935 [Myxococcales bacterium]|nr:hypothetical protein [Myxococcales bacterium]
MRTLIARPIAVALSFGFSLAALAACVGGDPPATAPAPSVTGDAGDAGDGVTCEAYCATVNKNCTGPNRQYRSDEECRRLCAFLSPGTAADRAQNTVGCRLANAKLGQSKEVCAAAGAWGGDVCGRRCETFCAINEASCGTLGGGAPYEKGDCLEKACPVLRFDPAVGDGPDQAFDGDDTLNCRAFHLVLATDNALATHCPHTALVSPTCQPRDAGGD